jgi:circadian clock protein KaiB
VESSEARFERLVIEHDRERVTLRLYVTGMAHQSVEAIALVKELCEEFLPGRYDLEVVDIYKDPARAREAQIFAAPTLVKERPEPIRRLIGRLSDRERVRVGLGVARHK